MCAHKNGVEKIYLWFGLLRTPPRRRTIFDELNSINMCVCLICGVCCEEEFLRGVKHFEITISYFFSCCGDVVMEMFIIKKPLRFQSDFRID